MSPGTLNLSIVIGATFGPVIITCQDADAAAVDLTGWSVWAEARETPADPVIVDLNAVITDAAAGEVTMSLTDEQTAVIAAAGDYKWDLLFENAGGERLGPYIKGVCKITDKITNPA